VTVQSPAVIDEPLALRISTTSQPGSDGRGSIAVVESQAGDGDASHTRVVAALAYAMDSSIGHDIEELATATLLSTLGSGGQAPLDEAGSLRQAFRAANTAIHQRLADQSNDVLGLSMAALISNDKYATIGIVGEARGYLARADRLNQVTRDQRIDKPQSRRGQQPSKKAQEKSGGRGGEFIGAEERLDSRLPALFELTLLPQDRVLIANSAVYKSQVEDRLMAMMISTTLDSGVRELSAGAATAEPALALVLSAEATRPVVAPSIQPAPSRQQAYLMPVLIVVVVILLGIIAAFLLL
jgi:serine/threonine protein phosphatase PrpC